MTEETGELRQSTFLYVMNNLKIKSHEGVLSMTYDQYNESQEITLIFEYDVYSDTVIEECFTSYNFDIKMTDLQESIFNNLVAVESEKIINEDRRKKQEIRDAIDYGEVGF